MPEGPSRGRRPLCRTSGRRKRDYALQETAGQVHVPLVWIVTPQLLSGAPALACDEVADTVMSID